MTNHERIEAFYTAFAQGDPATMTAQYHDEIVFSDPAFGTLKGDRAKAMWYMLLERSKGNIKVFYTNIYTSVITGSAQWTAVYPYGPKKRSVTNHVTASFIFKEGKIVEHRDSFNLHSWARQALGMPGLLLGWTGYMHKKVQKTTNALLDTHMQKRM